MKWTKEYDNETGANDEYFNEWWTVSNGEMIFKCSTEKEADYLMSKIAPTHEWEKGKCNGNCGMNYCDGYGCIENKPEGDVSHLLTPIEERNRVDANVYIDRAIKMLKEEYKDEYIVAGYNGIVSLLQYAKESHAASIPAPQPVSKYVDERAEGYADSIQPSPSPNKSVYYTTGDHWDDLYDAFKAGYAAAPQKGMDIREKYKQWCKETKRNGSVLVGGSMQEFFNWLDESPSPSEVGKDKGCACVNVDFGSYENQIEVVPPPHMAAYKAKQGGAPTICIDACLVQEVHSLWKAGITTTGCCCGHNKGQAFIGVINEDIPRMKEMGYQVAYNSSRPNDEDSFIAKSIK